MDTRQIEADLAKKYKYKPLKLSDSNYYRTLYRHNIPAHLNIDGGDVLYTKTGSKLCSSYDRIVIGDYGAFVEFSKPASPLVIECGQEYRLLPEFKNVKYNWVTIDDNSHVKIYHQRRTVTYADYVPGKFYVSVHEVYCSPNKE